MNPFKKIFLVFSLFTILMLAIFMSTAGSATATGLGNFPQEKVLIANVQFVAGATGTNDTINFAIANVGSISATITGCILKNETGNTVTFIELDSQAVVEKGTFKLITLTIKPDTLVDEIQYTLTVVSTMGGSFVSSAFDRSSTAEYDPLKDIELQSMLEKSAHSTPYPQGTTLYGNVYASIPNFVIIGSAIIAAFSILGAYKLSQHITGSKNKKDRFVVFIFASIIFVSIIVWIVSMIWGGTLATM